MAPVLRRGAEAPITSIMRGTTPINEIRRGSELRWSRAVIHDGFDVPGILERWINELRAGDLGALCLDITGTIRDGLGNIIGTTVKFVEGGVNGIGKLVNTAGTTLIDAYCGAWGGTAAPDGLIGLINGIPIFGPTVSDWLSGDFDIESIIGQIPVISEIGRLIGLFPDVEGNLLDPINYVVNAVGEVIGVLSCGEFKPTGGAFEGVCFVIGSLGNAARMLVPDGLMSLSTQVSRVRHETLLPGDDGFIETQIAELGDPGFATQLFRRFANDGSGARGVGMDFRNSQVSIVRRLASANVLVAPDVASYGAADTFRMYQAGNVHTLYKNGEPVTVWDDSTGTAASGASNRSVAMMMQSAKELSGARLFSPSLNYVDAA